MTNRLRISVVTVTLNRAHFIREAIESVLAQAYPDVEHIIVDGGSGDGTLEILKQYPHLRWISEPDGGMYEALNKGIRMATGEVVSLLNSDDALEPLVFTDVNSLFSPDDKVAAVVGGASVYRESLQAPKAMRVNPCIEWTDEQERWKRLTGNGLVTNAWFFRRGLFQQIGFFDESYRVTADRDFLLRVAISNVKVIPLHRQVYRYRNHETSLTMNPTDSRNPDRARVRMRTLREGTDIAEKFLLSGQVPVHAMPFLRRWHTERTYALAATALFHRQWHTAYDAVRRGVRFDPLWPISFAKLGFRRLARPNQRSD